MSCTGNFKSNDNGITCYCPVGYGRTGETCTQCTPGTYNSQINNPCSPMPAHAVVNYGSTGFTCLAGYIFTIDGKGCMASSTQSDPFALQKSDILTGYNSIDPTAADPYNAALETVAHSAISQTVYSTNTGAFVSIIPSTVVLDGVNCTIVVPYNDSIKVGNGVTLSGFSPVVLNNYFKITNVTSSSDYTTTSFKFPTLVTGTVTIGVVEFQQFPSFLASNLQACMNSPTCNYVGYDFSTDTATLYSSIPYVVDTSSTGAADYSLFSKHGIPVIMIEPPGYTYSASMVAYSGGIVNAASNVEACAHECTVNTACNGFNFRTLTGTCTLITGSLTPDSTVNGVGFMKTTYPNIPPISALDEGDLNFEGSFCQNYQACNADITTLVNSGVTTFSIADISSCMSCPLRSMNDTHVTNELGTYTATTWRDTLLYKNMGSDPSPRLTLGLYNIIPWAVTNTPTPVVAYTQNGGTFLCIDDQQTIWASFPQYGAADTRWTHAELTSSDISIITPVHYIDNGYKILLPNGTYFKPFVSTQDNVSVVQIKPNTTLSMNSFFKFGSNSYVIDSSSNKWNVYLGSGILSPIFTTTPTQITDVHSIMLNITPTNQIRVNDYITVIHNIFQVTASTNSSITISAIDPSISVQTIPQGSLIDAALVKNMFVQSQVDMLSWYNDTSLYPWKQINTHPTVADILLNFCYDLGPLPDPYAVLGLFRTLPLQPKTGAYYYKQGCDRACPGTYLLYNCYTNAGSSCDTANGGSLEGPACNNTWNACVEDTQILLQSYPPVLTNLTPIDIFRMDHNNTGYRGVIVPAGTGNRTDINSTQWSTVFKVDTQIVNGIHVNKPISISNPSAIFPSFQLDRLTALAQASAATTLEENAQRNCTAGYGVVTLHSYEFCQICPAGQFSIGGRNACAPCTPGNYCPQGSTNDTRKCLEGYYCSIPASQIQCPLGFFCPTGSIVPTSCDTGILPTSQTIQNVAISSYTGLDIILNLATAINFAPGAVANVYGVVGPVTYLKNPNTFRIVTPQTLSATLGSGLFTYQTIAHYCPVGTIEPLLCEIGAFCPLSSLQNPCPDANYCANSAGTQGGVFKPVPCPVGTYYKAPVPGSATTTAFGQANSLANQCYSCPSGTTVNSDQTGCTCASPQVWSSEEELCITSCPSGQEPYGSTCRQCPSGTYSPGPGTAQCIHCPTNFKSASNPTFTGCTCTNLRVDGATIHQGTVSWDASTNRCYISECPTGTTMFMSDCVPNVTIRWPYKISHVSEGFYYEGDYRYLYNGTRVLNCPPNIPINAGCSGGQQIDPTTHAVKFIQDTTCCKPLSRIDPWIYSSGLTFPSRPDGLYDPTVVLPGGRPLNLPVPYTGPKYVLDDNGLSFTSLFGSVDSKWVMEDTTYNQTLDYYNARFTTHTCPTYKNKTIYNYVSSAPVENQCILIPNLPIGLYGQDGKTPQSGLGNALKAITDNPAVLRTYFSDIDGVTACVAGYDCSTGLPCPPGYYCPGGTPAPLRCPSGYYCSGGTAQVVPMSCTDTGVYCPLGSSAQNPCPAGTYCPNSSQSLKCPAGTFNSSTGQTNLINACKECSAGQYCPSGSSSVVTCSAGQYCPDGKSQTQCARGSYCPTTSLQISCPAGANCNAPGISTNFATLNCSRTQTPKYSAMQCVNCTPATNYIYDSTSAQVTQVINISLVNGSYSYTRFFGITNWEKFKVGTNVTVVSNSMKIVGLVNGTNSNYYSITINPVAVSGIPIGVNTPNATWTIQPTGCDTVIPCGLGQTNSTDHTSCVNCPAPPSGYAWSSTSGCSTVRCTGGFVPSSDLKNCVSI